MLRCEARFDHADTLYVRGNESIRSIYYLTPRNLGLVKANLAPPPENDFPNGPFILPEGLQGVPQKFTGFYLLQN